MKGSGKVRNSRRENTLSRGKISDLEMVKKEYGDTVTNNAMSAIVVEELLSLKKHLDDKAKEKSKSK